jgi:phospholipase C
MAAGLATVDHIVVLMLENRSFDHMLGFLYQEAGNVSTRGDPFDGLTGTEACPGADGTPVPVFAITLATKDAYFLPGADPGEGFLAANAQLFGTTSPPAGAVPSMQGFVTDYAATLRTRTQQHRYVVPGTTAAMIMGCHTPATLPVLSALARGYAVCDHWFGSAPTQTLPNRAFASAGTSQGHLDDLTKSFTVPSIFGLCGQHGVSWKIYGYDRKPLTRLNFPDTTNTPATHIGLFSDFQSDAAAGTLSAYSFLEPSWIPTGNSQHPNYNVALGEQLILDTYRAVAAGPKWPQTLLIVTYDEHGGCYDHVPPPATATPPDDTIGEYAFDFTRFGPRVPTVLVSPLIAAGTVFRVPESATPLDHTSILATVEHRFSLPSLTRRDAAAVDVGAALTLSDPRTDDPLAAVSAPQAPSTPTELAGQPAHLDEIRTELEARPTHR